jgi:hypothetical protein
MAKRVNDREFAAVTALPAADRYSHFIRQVADWEEIWSLRNPGGWVLAGDDGGTQLVPVWPHARYAAACAVAAWGSWEGAQPAAIPLDRWLDTWSPGLARDGRQVAVFPTPDGHGIPVSAERLRDDLLEACEDYE